MTRDGTRCIENFKVLISLSRFYLWIIEVYTRYYTILKLGRELFISMKREFEVFNGKSGKLSLCTFYDSIHFMHAIGI